MAQAVVLHHVYELFFKIGLADYLGKLHGCKYKEPRAKAGASENAFTFST